MTVTQFFWGDKSGNNHHAKKRAGSPTYNADGFNSKPTVKLSIASLALDNLAIEFDGWSELTVLAALSHDDRNFATLIGKSNYAGWMSNSRDLAWSIFTHRLDGGYNLWGPTVITDTPSNYYGNNTGTKELQTQDGGEPGI